MVALSVEPYYLIIWLSLRPSRLCPPLVREYSCSHAHVWLLPKLHFDFNTLASAPAGRGFSLNIFQNTLVCAPADRVLSSNIFQSTLVCAPAGRVFSSNAYMRVSRHKTLAIPTWFAIFRPARPTWVSRTKFSGMSQFFWVRHSSIHIYNIPPLRPCRPSVLPPSLWMTSKFTHMRWVSRSYRSNIGQSLCNLYRRMILFSLHPPL